MVEILKKYYEEFKTGTKKMFKEFFKLETNKIQRANMWTFTRLVTPIITVTLSVIAIITASIPLFITTACIAGFGAFTDKLDGASARKYESFSEYGKVLDQITDKSFAGIIGINLLFLNPLYIFVLLGEALISLVNISYKLKYKNINIDSTIFGKVKQTPLFLSLALGYLSTINPTLLTISNYSIILVVLFQVTTAVSYIENNNKEVKKLKNSRQLKLYDTLNDIVKDNELVKTNSIQLNNAQVIEKNNTISRTKQCEKLKKLRTEIILTTDYNDTSLANLKNEKEEKKGYQKVKK